MKDKVSVKLSNIILVVLILFLTTFIVVFSINYLESDKTVIKSGNEIKQSSKSIALMLETTLASGEYKVNNDSIWPSTGYKFNSTLSKCENGSILTYDNVTKKVIVQSNKSDKCFVYFDKIPTFTETLIINNGTIRMDHHTASLANGANDGSYRFSGANPNNYVCFGPGSTAAGQTCPEENQYRIIGVFGDQVKLIKKTSVGNKVWNSSNVNTWAGSTLETYLNGEYLNSLTPTWSNKIASNIWQVGGMTDANGRLLLPITSYTYEIGENNSNFTTNSKIGLIYVSDYGFAAKSQAWSLMLGGDKNNVNDYSNPIAKANNWLFAGSVHSHEWTVSRILDTNNLVFVVISNGSVDNNYATSSFAVRPSFYLETPIYLNGGNGTSIDPYRV
ncbi:MAG: DUF6273 domain-containing protein [Bacilli bacterium]